MWMEERDESRPADIEGALHNYKRKCCLCFSKSMEVKDLNQAEVFAILETLKDLFARFFK